MQHETIEGYRQYFHGIVGFFVVEDHVMNTASTLVNRSYLDDVWNIAASKIASSVRTHSVSVHLFIYVPIFSFSSLYMQSYCTDPALMLKIKNLVMLFSSTLRVSVILHLLHPGRHSLFLSFQTYGYSVSQLVELLQEIRDHYNEVLMQRWVHVFRDIFDEDNYHPIQVLNAENELLSTIVYL